MGGMSEILTLFIYAFIRTLRIIIKKDGTEKNFAPA